MWPFKRKPQPVRDARNWNEDWRVGEIAECVKDNWHKDTPPWHRPVIGQRFTVVGFSEGLSYGRMLHYFLKLDGWSALVSTTAFRKVRPVSSVVEQIMTATPGTDRVRETQPTS